MVRDVPNPPTDNKGFIDNFLEFGIGHYYTTSKLLAGGIDEYTSPNELRSIALEQQVLASTAFELLITWFYALQEFTGEDNKRLLVDVLPSVWLNDEKRTSALEFVKNATRSDFAKAFNISDESKVVREHGMDPAQLADAVSVAQRNLNRMFFHMYAPFRGKPEELEPHAWMTHMLIKIKHGFLVVGSEVEEYPSVVILTEGSQFRSKVGSISLFATNAQMDNRELMNKVIGNMAIALRSLIHVIYAYIFGAQPISTVVDRIARELYPDASDAMEGAQ